MSWVEWLIVGTFVFIAFIALVGGAQEQKAWEQFKAEHACRVVSKATPTTAMGFDSSGNISFHTIEGKTGWLCNDGVTYYR